MQNQVPVSQNRPVTGRFAPSPSGRLHLGNLACSLLAWLSAKSQGGRIVLRIEDLDAERCPRVYADLLEQDLAWLGLTWDEGGSTGGAHAPYYQSECGDIYTQSYRKLEQKGLVYPCFCSRSQLHAASAPHTSDGNVIYPGTCRGLTPEEIASVELATGAPESLQQETAEGLTLESTLGTDSPEERMVEHIALREAIDQLPEREKMTILLRFFKGLTQEQTARILGVSQVQISRLERRGLADLRRLLDG